MFFFIIVACELTLSAPLDFKLSDTVMITTTVITDNPISSSYHTAVLCKAELDYLRNPIKTATTFRGH